MSQSVIYVVTTLWWSVKGASRNRDQGRIKVNFLRKLGNGNLQNSNRMKFAVQQYYSKETSAFVWQSS